MDDVVWTHSALADIDSLFPDRDDREFIHQALHAQLKHPALGRPDFFPYAVASNPSFFLRAGRFALIYQMVAGNLVVTAVRESLDVPLSVLIWDEDEQASSRLAATIRSEPDIAQVLIVSSKMEAPSLWHINTIFIDPQTIGLDATAEFISEIQQSYPDINVVLYLDEASAEQDSKEFFRGHRNVFFRYPMLDKKTAQDIFQEETAAILKICRRRAKWKASEASVKDALRATEDLQTPEELPTGLLKTAYAGLEELAKKAGIAAELERKKSVFLSYRFDDREMVDGFRELLEEYGFTVYTGESVNTYIHRGILERIRKAEFFLSLMTFDEEKKDGSYTASPWVLEEKGAALALGKRPVLMVQEGIRRTGGLHGDRQLIYFNSKSFMKQALKAVRQLKAYLGEPDEPEE